MTPSSEVLRCDVGSHDVHQPGQVTPEMHDGWKVELCAHAIADRDRQSAQALDRFERGQVREVVAGVERLQSAERPLVEKCLDGVGLGGAARRDLEHATAGLDTVVAAQRIDDVLYFAGQLDAERRCAPVMQGDGETLVLDLDRGVPPRELFELASGAVNLRRIDGGTMDKPSGVATLEAVQTRQPASASVRTARRSARGCGR